jgi:hypothetical protein
MAGMERRTPTRRPAGECWPERAGGACCGGVSLRPASHTPRDWRPRRAEHPPRPWTSGCSRPQALPIHPGERCAAKQRQQQLEGGIEAALQLLQGAGADLADRAPLQCPLTADPSGEGIDQQLGADHHRQDLEHKPLVVERRLGRPGCWVGLHRCSSFAVRPQPAGAAARRFAATPRPAGPLPGDARYGECPPEIVPIGRYS